MSYVETIADYRVKTDVLVIGAGIAGTMAAVSSSQSGCSTALVSNGSLGRSGNSIMAIAIFRVDGESAHECGERKADKKFTRQKLFENIVKDGYYLSEQDIVRQYIQDVPEQMLKFLNWGREAKQRFMFLRPASWLTTGRSIGLTCRHAIKKQSSVQLFENIMVQELLMANGRICGALGVDIYTGELVVFESKAVVLATGGYDPYSFKCSFSSMTGDGMAMALRAGASLADMEFLMLIPGVLISPRVHRSSILPFVLHIGGMIDPDITDKNNNSIRSIIPDDLYAMAQGNEWMKLIYSYFWSKELAAGNGTHKGGFYFDFSKKLGLKQIAGAVKAFVMLKTMYKKKWRFQGKDASDLYQEAKKGGRWEVGLSNQYSLGGIVVNREMECALPGLFAGGEVSSGLFGANRVASALTEALVLGYRSGCSAAKYAKGCYDVRIDKNYLDDSIARISRIFNNPGKKGVSEVRCAFEDAADAGFSMIRDQKRLEEALGKIVKIREYDLPQVGLKGKSRAYNLEWLEALQLENLLTCTEIGIRSAIARSESRGFHVRADFPQVDNVTWLNRITFKKENNGFTLTYRKPDFSQISPPLDCFADIMEYASLRKKEIDTQNR